MNAKALATTRGIEARGGAAAAPARPGWVFSASLDVALFAGLPTLVATAVVVCAALLGLSQVGVEYYPISFLLYVCIDLTHQYATPMFTVAFADERARRRRFYQLAPPLIFAALVGLNALGPALFLGFYALYSVYHFMRQQYGWMMLAARRSGARPGWALRLDQAAIYTATLCPFLYLLCQQDTPGWFTIGDLPSLPAAWGPWVLLPGALVAAAYAAVQAARWLRQGRPDSARLLIWASTLGIWWSAFVLVPNSLWGISIIIAHHGLPYLALATRFGRRKLAAAAPPSAAEARASSHAARLARRRLGRRVALLGAATLALAALHFLIESRPEAMLASWLPAQAYEGLVTYALYPALGTIGIFHFVVDSFFWKRKHNPDLGLL